ANRVLASRASYVQLLADEGNQLTKKVEDYGKDIKLAAEMKKWDQAAISWLDELYDVSALFSYRLAPSSPQKEGFLVKKWVATAKVSARAGGAGKDKGAPAEKHAAHISLTGEVRGEDVDLASALRDRLN